MTGQHQDIPEPVEPAVSDESISNWITLFGQFAGMAAIALIGADAWPWPPATWVLVGLGVCLAALALPSLGTSFRVHPVPNGRGLRQTGLYALTRNPMYLGLILVALGICIHARPLAWLFFAFLCVVLTTKIAAEERFLTAAYPEFAEYRGKVKKLIPFIW